jgi:hypothetical protein
MTKEQIEDAREALAEAGLPQPTAPVALDVQPLMPFGSDEPADEVGEDPTPEFQPAAEAAAIAQADAEQTGLMEWVVLDGPSSYGPITVDGNPKYRAMKGKPFRVPSKDERITLLASRLFRLAVRRDFAKPYSGPMTTTAMASGLRGAAQTK